jgi:diguanylate cyclase (GGDEF)-like protein
MVSANEATDPFNGKFARPDGQRVRALRKGKGLTQQQLATKAGYGKRTIEHIEHGRRHKVETLRDVAGALEVDLEGILSPAPECAAGDGPGTFTGSGPPLLLQTPRFVQDVLPLVPEAPNPGKCSVLVVDDEPAVLSMLSLQLSAEFEVFEAESADAAEAIFSRRPIDIILTDQQMPGRTGMQLLEWVLRHHPRTTRLLMTTDEKPQKPVAAADHGPVYQAIPKSPLSLPWLLFALSCAAAKVKYERTIDQLLEQYRPESEQRTRDQERARLATDARTGLLDGHAIEKLAREELKGRIRYERPLSIGLLEVDPCNALQGENLQNGSDEILEKLAWILHSSLREVDKVGRLEGGKFLAVVREAGEAGAAKLAERLRATVAATPFKCNGQVIPITFSIGFAVADGKVLADFEAMTDLAAAALAQAKSAGGNCCQIRTLPTPLPEEE